MAYFRRWLARTAPDSTRRPPAPYIDSMSSRSSKRKPTGQARPRSWRASLILKHGKILGNVEAPTREAAEAAAVREFNIPTERRSRLVVQEIL